MITELHVCLEEAYAKIDYLKNCTRHYNFCIWSLPETVKNITSIIYSLMQSAVPNIDEIHIKIDCIHMALVFLKPDGPPRDVIIKPNFFRVKETLCQGTVDQEVEGFKIQNFADISQTTILKQRVFKLLLPPLV